MLGLFRAQLLQGGFVTGLVKLLASLMEAEDARKVKSEPYNLESLFFASKIANTLQETLVDPFPSKKALLDEVLTFLWSFSFSLLGLALAHVDKGSDDCRRYYLF